MNKPPTTYPLTQKLLIGILSGSVLLRVIAAIFLGNQIIDMPGIFDQISYHTLALRLLDGYGFSFGEVWWPATPANEPTAHWSYLYTLYITVIYFIFGPNPLIARLIQAVAVGVLMPWLIYRIAQRVYQQPGSEWIGLIAAAISAVYIYFIYYGAALVTESFYIVAFLWIIDLALQISQSEKSETRHWLWLGVALATAVLLRQLFLLFIPFLLLWLWWAARPRLAQLALPLTILIIAILPWTVRNYLAFDQFVLLNTNAGYAFYWGNHPVHGVSFTPILTAQVGANYRDTLPPDLMSLGLNEAALDNALLQRGIEFVLADPLRYILLSLSRIPHYFIFWPSANSGLMSNLSRVASFGLFLPFMLYGLYLSGRQWPGKLGDWLKSPPALFYLFILIYTGIHVLTWTLVRYRLPIDSILLLFAGLAFYDLAIRFGILRQNRAQTQSDHYAATQLAD